MKTILIFTVLTYYGAATTSAEFATPQACENAAAVMRASVIVPDAYSVANVTAVCLPQKLPNK